MHLTHNNHSYRKCISQQTFGLSRAAAAVYINIFRNIPLIPLLLLLVFGLPGVYQALMGSPMPAGIEFPMLIAGLTFNTSAYLAEEIRSGIRGVPGTQWDAGRVFGIGPTRLLVSVIYPQALRIALPAVGNRLVHNMKNSTVALVLPLDVDSMEVLGQAGRVAGQTFAWAEPLIFAALVHLCLALLFGAIVSWLAARAQSKVDLVP